jgi:tetratricopeptide (TPR) repeat protein
MSVNELLFELYAWADQRALLLLIIAVLVPLIGTASVLAVGRTTHPARQLASAVGGFALLAGAIGAAATAAALGVLDRSLMDANAVLLAAPLLGVGLSLLGLRLMMPLAQVPLFRSLLVLVGAMEPPAAGAAEAPAPEAAALSRRVPVVVAVGLVVLGAGLIAGRRLTRSDASAASGPLSIAVADISNETGEKELNSLSGLLITALGQSRKLEVMSRLSMFDVLRQMGRERVERIDETLALEVCRRAGTRALAVASLQKFDQLYTLDLKVVGVESGKFLFTAQEKGEGKASIPAMLDRLAERTRAGLREHREDISANARSVATLATPVLESYQRYFEAEQLFAQGRYLEVRPKLEEAVKLDPSFAVAHFKLAYLSEFSKELRGIDAAGELQRALQLLDRAPARDQLLIKGFVAQHEKRKAEAIALFERALAEFPPDKMAYYMAGDIRFHDHDHVGAVPYFEKAIGIDPLFVPALQHLTVSYTVRGNLARAVEVARQALERAPDYQPDYQTAMALAAALARLGREPEAQQALQRALQLTPPLYGGCNHEAVPFYMRLPTLDRAVAELEKCQSVVDPAKPGLVDFRAVAASIYLGKYAQAARLGEQLEALPKLPEDARLGVRLARVALLHDAGDRSASRRMLEELESQVRTPELQKGVAKCWLLLGDLARAKAYAAAHSLDGLQAYFDAAEAAGRNDYAAAAAALQPVMAESADLRHATERRNLLPLVAQWRLEAGQPREAVAAADQVLNEPWFEFGSSAAAYGKALIVRGKALEKLGQKSAARASYERAMALWAQADDLPEVRELKARLANFH